MRAPVALAAMALALLDSSWRRSQSLSLIQTIPLVCALPENPKPATVSRDSTTVFSF